VGRRPRIPPRLTKRPFSLEEALNSGVTLDALRGKSWRRLGSKLYCWSGLREDPEQLLRAWQRRLPKDTVFAGATAAWLLGLDFDPVHPIEVVMPLESGVRSRPGLVVRRCDLRQDDIVEVNGLRTTTLLRSLCDLCLRLSAVETLVALDATMRLGLADRSDLMTPRGWGSRRLRSLVDLAAPAESPMETRLRWLLIEGGLPRPEVQISLSDADDFFVGRADLYYPTARLVVEYDGATHRDRLVEDNRRQNLLINAGFRLLRFTAADIHQRPEVVVAQVRHALLAPKTLNQTRLKAVLDPKPWKGMGAGALRERATSPV